MEAITIVQNNPVASPTARGYVGSPLTAVYQYPPQKKNLPAIHTTVVTVKSFIPVAERKKLAAKAAVANIKNCSVVLLRNCPCTRL
tara:strand:- start:499 stop:756 length:258 start_codon:yes stop_codon:yes gene_type:complete